jgi:hypothetical protein
LINDKENQNSRQIITALLCIVLVPLPHLYQRKGDRCGLGSGPLFLR